MEIKVYCNKFVPDFINLMDLVVIIHKHIVVYADNMLLLKKILLTFILEKDRNNDVLWAWTYPSVSEVQKSLLLRKCTFDTAHQFLYGRFRSDWFYISCTEVFDSDNLPGVSLFTVSYNIDMFLC